MPAEPVPADLPADPVMADAPVPVAPPMTSVADEGFDQADALLAPGPAVDEAVASVEHALRRARLTRPALPRDEDQSESDYNPPDNRGSRGRPR